MANLLHLGKKKEQISLLCPRFFVTLQEFAGFLYIKAIWGIEEKLGYELATLLNSTFCYELHQRTPDGEPPAVLWLIIGCKGNHFL
jgi:hypothetical protein